MLKPVKINVKPLSINDAYRGRRFVTPEYIKYKSKLMELLPNDVVIPPGPYQIYFEFGFSSHSSDWDNCIKTTQDCIARKYKFNDRYIRRGSVQINYVPKGEEYFTFKIETYTP